MHKLARCFPFFIIFASLIPRALSAQEIPSDNGPILPAEDENDKDTSEDSAYLINTKFNEMDVELIWDGYWRIRFVAGGAFGKKNSQNIYPGLQRGVVFTQEPDVTLSLWLNKRWFIETVFQGSLERNSYRGGYVGQGNEFVQEVIVGNRDVSATAYAGMEVPSPHENTPGISAKFLTPKSKHEFLLRFDPSDSKKKVFQGQYEISTQDIGLMEFIEGKYFILPDKNISGLVVYLENSNGSINGRDGLGTERRYRLAQDAEYFIDKQNGLLEFRSPQEGQVIVHYKNQNNEPVGTESIEGFIIKPDSNLRPELKSIEYTRFEFNEIDVYDPGGRRFEITSKVDINGTGYLILYEPGRFTPFERQNVYRSNRPLPEESWRIVPQLRNRGVLYPTEPINFVPNIQEKTITVYSSADSADGLRYPANRYPFAVSNPQAYGPGRETDPAKFSKTIVLAVREKNSGYYLGTGVVPGSVVVYINGIRDRTVKVSEDDRLIFSHFIYLDDWIEARFRVESSGFTGGDLFIYQGNQFQLTPQLTLELAESIRWNINQERSVSKYEQSPGTITAATILDWKRDNTGVRLSGDVTLATPDTTGNLRLFGMEDGGLSFVFLESTLFEAPKSIPNITTSREKADKYNYFSSDSFGRKKLNNYLWAQAASTGEDGPALAARRDGDPSGGRVMDLRFDFPGDREEYWSAGDFLVDVKNSINLSSYTGIEFPIMFLNNHGNGPGLGNDVPNILLQIGEIGESKDYHKDGIVNSVDSGRMLEWNLTKNSETKTAIKDAWKSSGTWKTLRILLTAAQRVKLSSVRALRLVITNTSAQGGDALELNGRAILGSPKFDGSSFRNEIRNESNELASNQHVAGVEIVDNALDRTLGSSFPELSSLFHQEGKENKVLKLSWGEDVPGGVNIGANDRWEAISWFSGIPMEAYRTLVFFVYDEKKLGSGAITAKITDENGSGIKISWTSSKGKEWDRIKVDIAKGTADSALGNPIEAVTIDKNAGELTRFVFSGVNAEGDASSSNNSGTIYFDEVYFRDPAYSVTGSARVNAYWRYEKDVAKIGNFPVLGDIALDGSVDISGGTVISKLGRKNVAYSGSMGISTDILGMELDTDWQGAWKLGKLNWSGNHSLRIPANYEVFWFKDAYSRGKSGEVLSFSRLNDLNLKLDLGGLRFFSDAIYDSGSVIQSWGGQTAWEMEGWNSELSIKYILNSKKFKASSEDYFSSWIKDYVLLWPASGEVSNREIHHISNITANIEAFSVEWNPELRMKANRAPEWHQENRWAGTLAFPIRFPSWAITPSYRRSLRQLIDTNEEGNGTYGSVWYSFVSSIRGQLPLFTYTPFRELFGRQDGRIFERVTKGMLEADYEVKFALDVRRVVGSKLIDLFIPNYTDFSVERKYLRKGDTIGWENEWRGTMGFEAINLFGNFGTYPIVSVYNSDRLSTLLQVVLKDLNSTSAPAPHELLWQSNWIFTGERNKSFIFDHRIYWHWDDGRRDTRQEAKLEYRWRTASKDVLRLPLFKQVILTQHYLENRERLLLKGRYPWEDAPDTTTFSMIVTMRHESAWVFPDVGEFKGWLALGLGAFGEAFSNGWELGIEAELHF